MDDLKAQNSKKGGSVEISFTLSKSSSLRKHKRDDVSLQIESEVRASQKSDHFNKREMIKVQKSVSEVQKQDNGKVKTRSRKCKKGSPNPSKEMMESDNNKDQCQSQYAGQARPRTSSNSASQHRALKSGQKQGFRPSRVSAHSSVNFDFLTVSEQNERYKNMLVQYFRLKKRVHQMEEEKFQEALKGGGKSKAYRIHNANNLQIDLKNASDKVQKEKYEIDDCSMLIPNIVSIIAKKTLKADSVEMLMICELVRRCLPSEEEDSESEESFPVPKNLLKFFANLSKEDVVEFFSGVKPEGAPLTKQEYAPRIKRKKTKGSAFQGVAPQVPVPIQSSMSFNQTGGALSLSHANALVGLNASMLEKFNFQHPQTQEVSLAEFQQENQK